MNKEQFLAALRARLTGLPQPDLERTLQYYREMIDDRVEEGMSEQAAVADVGDPDELAAAILQKPVRSRAAGERKPMSGGKKAILMICAAALIAGGLLLIIGSLSGTGRKRSMKEKEYTFAGNPFSALEIDAGSAEVKLYPATDGVCRVVCTEGAARRNEVGVVDGTLRIVRVYRWSLFSFDLSKDYIHVYLPERDYESLSVESSSGGVSIPEDFRFRTAVIDASSGGVGFAAEVTEELNIQTSSGGVAVAGASPKTLFIKASSGGVALSGTAPGNAELYVSSGGMRLTDVRCSGDLSAESSSGAIRFSDVIAGGVMRLECSSGTIKLEDCDAAELHLHCTSGAITGHLLTPKTYIATATSGSVRVPESGSGGVCEIRTTSGSIRFD